MRRKTLLSLFCCVLGLFAAYQASTFFLAYTDDAFVTTDLLRIAPLVDGAVAEVPVVEDQLVKKGELLLALDDTPQRLAVHTDQAALEAAQARLALFENRLAQAKTAQAKAEADLRLAQGDDAPKDRPQIGRIVSRPDDAATAAGRKAAEDGLAAANDSLREAAGAVEAQKAALPAAQARLDQSRYDLARTKVFAPADGYVTGLRVRPGDLAKAGEPILGLIANDAWRITANYPESLVRHMAPGQRVLVTLDGHPWRLFHGVVHGVGRGVARRQDQGGLLPEVEAKTNWIRLARRFPVRIELTEVPSDPGLRLGADARTLVLY
jgi:membrane fusion protein, multidrug efflux system